MPVRIKNTKHDLVFLQKKNSPIPNSGIVLEAFKKRKER